jgi:hypothetical protein
LVFNNSAGQKILDAEIIIVKAKPEILLTIQSMNFSDNRGVWLQFDVYLGQKYKIWMHNTKLKQMVA